MDELAKIRNCAHRGGQEGAKEAPRADFGVHFGLRFKHVSAALDYESE